MIESFSCKETQKVWRLKHSRKLPTQIQAVALRKLRMLDAAKDLLDLRVPPSNQLEELKGRLKGFQSIRINQQWRLVFRWDDGAHEVKITDYH